MRRILESGASVDILKQHETVYILKSFQWLEEIQLKSIRDYQFRKTLDLNNPKDVEEEMYEYREIKVSVCRDSNQESMVNFIPFIYQESNNIENNKFIVFDIIKNQLQFTLSNNPGQSSLKHLYEDNRQFNVFAICQTSDVYEDKEQEKKGKCMIKR